MPYRVFRAPARARACAARAPARGACRGAQSQQSKQPLFQQQQLSKQIGFNYYSPARRLQQKPVQFAPGRRHR
jgi:hypothetical protein